MIRITVWNEYKHERELEEIKKIYPKGIHECIREFLEEKCSAAAVPLPGVWGRSSTSSRDMRNIPFITYPRYRRSYRMQ